MSSDTLSQAEAYLEKCFGKGIIMDLTGAVNLFKCVPSGHPFIDYVMGGGVPYGKMVEIFGRPMSGKTTLSMLIAAQAQRQKNKTGRVLWLDYEHAFDKRYFLRLGGFVGRDYFLVSQPSTAEEGMEIARVFITRGLCDLIVTDSVAAMMSEKESGDWIDSSGNVTADGKGKQRGAMGDQQIGLHARVITQGIKQLQAKIGPPEVGIIWINQIRTKIATRKGQQSTETTTGGHAIKFYSGIRLEMQRVKSKKGKLYDPIENKVLDNQIIAIETRVKGAKNRCAPPFRDAVVTVTFGQGLDLEADLLRMATNHNLIKKGGTGWYSAKDIGATRNVRGEVGFKKLLKEEPKVKKFILDKLKPLLDNLDETVMTVVDEEREDEKIEEILTVKPSFNEDELVESKELNEDSTHSEDEELTELLKGEASKSERSDVVIDSEGKALTFEDIVTKQSSEDSVFNWESENKKDYTPKQEDTNNPAIEYLRDNLPKV